MAFTIDSALKESAENFNWAIEAKPEHDLPLREDQLKYLINIISEDIFSAFKAIPDIAVKMHKTNLSLMDACYLETQKSDIQCIINLIGKIS